MKKLNLIHSFTALGTLAAATPVVATACSSKTIDDKLVITVDGYGEGKIAASATAEWTISLSYNGNVGTPIKTLDVSSSDDSIVKAEVDGDQSAGKIKLTAGANANTATITIKVTDTEDHYNEKEVNVTVTTTPTPTYEITATGTLGIGFSSLAVTLTNGGELAGQVSNNEAATFTLGTKANATFDWSLAASAGTLTKDIDYTLVPASEGTSATLTIKDATKFQASTTFTITATDGTNSPTFVFKTPAPVGPSITGATIPDGKSWGKTTGSGQPVTDGAEVKGLLESGNSLALGLDGFGSSVTVTISDLSSPTDFAFAREQETKGTLVITGVANLVAGKTYTITITDDASTNSDTFTFKTPALAPVATDSGTFGDLQNGDELNGAVLHTNPAAGEALSITFPTAYTKDQTEITGPGGVDPTKTTFTEDSAPTTTKLDYNATAGTNTFNIVDNTGNLPYTLTLGSTINVFTAGTGVQSWTISLYKSDGTTVLYTIKFSCSNL